jgi:hypothetical protein
LFAAIENEELTSKLPIGARDLLLSHIASPLPKAGSVPQALDTEYRMKSVDEIRSPHQSSLSVSLTPRYRIGASPGRRR